MITHENTGLTRAIVHEVMHDTTAVNEKETTSRMPTGGERRSLNVYTCGISRPLREQGQLCLCFQTYWFSTVAVGEGCGT